MSAACATDVAIWMLALAYLIGPGVLMMVWLFPDERLAWQVAMGGGIGVALLGLAALGLSYLPTGITRGSIIIAVIVLGELFAMLLGWAPEQVLHRVSRLLFALKWYRRLGWRGYLPSALALLALAGFLLAMPSLGSAGYTESYSEFYIVDGLLEVPPWRRPVAAVEPVPLTLAVISHEQTAEPFEVHVLTGGETIQVIHLGTLRPGAGTIRSILIPPRTSSRQHYTLALYRGGLESIYRSLSFWLHTPPDQPAPAIHRTWPLGHHARR